MKWGHVLCYLPKEDYEHYPKEWWEYEAKYVRDVPQVPSSQMSSRTNSKGSMNARGTASTDNGTDNWSRTRSNDYHDNKNKDSSAGGWCAGGDEPDDKWSADKWSLWGSWSKGEASKDGSWSNDEASKDWTEKPIPRRWHHSKETQRQASQEAQEMNDFKIDFANMQGTISMLDMKVARATESSTITTAKIVNLSDRVDALPKLCTVDKLKDEVAAATASTHQLTDEMQKMTAMNSDMDAKVVGIGKKVTSWTRKWMASTRRS